MAGFKTKPVCCKQDYGSSFHHANELSLSMLSRRTNLTHLSMALARKTLVGFYFRWCSSSARRVRMLRWHRGVTCRQWSNWSDSSSNSAGGSCSPISFSQVSSSFDIVSTSKHRFSSTAQSLDRNEIPSIDSSPKYF